MKHSNSLKFALAASTLLSTPVLAQTSDDDIEEVIVTAGRRAQPASEVAKSVSVISAEDIQLGQFSFLLDAVQTLPGVSINQNGAFGGTAFVSLRGSATDQTVVLIDGVQVNDGSAPGGGFDFARLDPSGVERIEVLKGPQAVLYGSDAIGGVINIITKSGSDSFGGDAYAEYGAFESFRAGGSIRGGNERFGYSVSAGFVDQGGISAADSADGNTETDGFENLTLRGKLTAKVSEHIRFEVASSYVDSESEFDGFVFANGIFALGDTDDLNKTEEFSIAGRGFVDLLDGRFKNTFSVEYSEIDRNNFSGGVFSNGATANRTNFDYLGEFALDEGWTLLAGAQHEEVDAETVDPEPLSISSVFGSLAYSADGLSFAAGLRHDDHETFGGTTNAEVNAAYLFEDSGSRLHAAWSEGFKAPTIFQLTFSCCGFDANPNLNPERANAWEVGLTQPFENGRGQFGATYFEQRTRDLIIFTFTGGYQNVDRASATGFEFTLDYDLRDDLTLQANYTITDAEDRTTGDRLIRRPKNQAFASLSWQATEQLNTSIAFTYNGREADSAGPVEGWRRVDVRASYRLDETWELYGRIDNLFDTEYQQVNGYGTPGISAFGGVRTRF
ncbi:MAG: TonB-dependent receptor [Kordiimonadaceae bacterium]|nr:TonB-dependent receptor [Kordiimonadaceae bacterium]MBO6567383.1 TonB-dependent receptor [Kordiimonadaceae bacterium]MBO6963403.1 TonB-dependent receptor [Kordiimonadaceae bacterium]